MRTKQWNSALVIIVMQETKMLNRIFLEWNPDMNCGVLNLSSWLKPSIEKCDVLPDACLDDEFGCLDDFFGSLIKFILKPQTHGNQVGVFVGQQQIVVFVIEENV